ncbi:MAG: hypothetical protein SPL49_01775 [Oribacterium sp.]|jgi:hypothetical protein|nr:hypothetical protein [Oribacterium sp.]MDY6307483.1 hypothetical protein [Oribacterium sp.]MDY6315936.1 hypothetical protein [Oribacterium sp.]
MNFRENRSFLNITFLELILSVLIFSVVSSFCIFLSSKAYKLSKETEVYDLAVNKTVSAAELIRSAESLDDLCTKLHNEAYVEHPEEANAYIRYYDENRNPAENKSLAVYQLSISYSFQESSKLLTALVVFAPVEGKGKVDSNTIRDTNNTIYQLEIKRYLQNQ